MLGTDADTPPVGLGTCIGTWPEGDLLTAILLDSGSVALVGTQVTVEPAPSETGEQQMQMLTVRKPVRRLRAIGRILYYGDDLVQPGLVPIQHLCVMTYDHADKLAAQLVDGDYILVTHAGIPFLRTVAALPGENTASVTENPGPSLFV